MEGLPALDITHRELTENAVKSQIPSVLKATAYRESRLRELDVITQRLLSIDKPWKDSIR
jgi:hypothetical protein